MNFESLDKIAAGQHGLVTTGQLHDLGATKAWIHSQVRAGRLVRLRVGVYRLGGVPVTRDQACLAAVLSARAECVLSHGSAATAWGFARFEAPPSIDLLSHRWRPRLPGVRGHETLWLPDRDVTLLRRMPITAAPRTLVDASGELDEADLGRSLDDALRRRLLSLPRLVACFDEVPWSGRRPSRVLRKVLAERVPGFDPGGSDPELDVLRVLRRAGIRPLPKQQYRIVIDGRAYVADYAWPETKHVLEYLGALVHGNAAALHADSGRVRAFQHAGWTAWPVTSATTVNELIAIGVTATVALAA